MSDLTSVFDVHFGWPNSCALSHDFPPKAGVTLPAGTIVTPRTKQLRSAIVLRIKTDATGGGSPPSLVLADAGKAYVVNTWGVGYNNGDIVEWDGTKFNVIVPHATGDVPVIGTRVVVIEAGGAGSFTGHANKILTCTVAVDPEDPPTWEVTTTPASGNQIDINGANSIYYMKRFSYTTVWALTDKLSLGYSHAYVDALTSPAVANPKPSAWVVLEGNDQFDGEFTGEATCAKLPTGCTVKVKCAVANTLVPGEFVEAEGGLVKKCNGTNHAIGQVDWSNATAGAGGIIIFTGV